MDGAQRGSLLKSGQASAPSRCFVSTGVVELRARSDDDDDDDEIATWFFFLFLTDAEAVEAPIPFASVTEPSCRRNGRIGTEPGESASRTLLKRFISSGSTNTATKPPSFGAEGSALGDAADDFLADNPSPAATKTEATIAPPPPPLPSPMGGFKHPKAVFSPHALSLPSVL